MGLYSEYVWLASVLLPFSLNSIPNVFSQTNPVDVIYFSSLSYKS